MSNEIRPNNTQKVKYNNTEIKNLSEQQKHIRLQIDSCKNKEEVQLLRKKRNIILKEIHQKVNKPHKEKNKRNWR